MLSIALLALKNIAERHGGHEGKTIYKLNVCFSIVVGWSKQNKAKYLFTSIVKMAHVYRFLKLVQMFNYVSVWQVLYFNLLAQLSFKVAFFRTCVAS